MPQLTLVPTNINTAERQDFSQASLEINARQEMAVLSEVNGPPAVRTAKVDGAIHFDSTKDIHQKAEEVDELLARGVDAATVSLQKSYVVATGSNALDHDLKKANAKAREIDIATATPSPVAWEMANQASNISSPIAIQIAQGHSIPMSEAAQIALIEQIAEMQEGIRHGAAHAQAHSLANKQKQSTSRTVEETAERIRRFVAEQQQNQHTEPRVAQAQLLT